ncbi:hypothetical protein LY474_12205 [Myxococcus stipitatus]|uniref:hypothetical protein n=1 Tax=Myxococcus stipitatus TaxID=83455 RepID=UPI001F1A2279|nr:hypothetical protein [Myxococcus stipitatus]MCE9668576.1 hypothetical protein [Myxococcus stipitatus]
MLESHALYHPKPEQPWRFALYTDQGVSRGVWSSERADASLDEARQWLLARLEEMLPGAPPPLTWREESPNWWKGVPVEG